jgi:hypothetical protein
LRAEAIERTLPVTLVACSCPEGASDEKALRRSPVKRSLVVETVTGGHRVAGKFNPAATFELKSWV